MASGSFKAVQTILGYSFKAPELLREALTHKSYLNELRGPDKDTFNRNNERLEFLGDAVLDLAISERLIDRHPEFAEGELSKRKARIVSEGALARVARKLEVGKFLLVGKGEERTAGRDKPSLLADAMEAVIAAVYLDGGYAAARDLIFRTFEDEILRTEKKDDEGDYKTDVQELCQREFDTLPVYRVVKETGPDHQKTFEVSLTVRKRVLGKGKGRSKKEAEQRAARETLEKIKKTLT
ncbi:MAG TPA: ribonuclease III [Nitrospiria bacterium]